MALTHLIVIDPKSGERVTSYVVPIHGKTYEVLLDKAQADYPGYLYLRDNDGTLQKILTRQDAHWLNNKVEIRPSQLHDWDGTKWVLNHERQAALLDAQRQQLIDDIDNTASSLITKWTRFESEYKERGAAALSYQSQNYQGEVSIYITSFANAANIDNKSATLLILKQANQLRDTLAKMSALRMRKYELKQSDLTQEQMQQIHDNIIAEMQALAEAQQ